MEQKQNSLLQQHAAELLGRLRDNRAVEALLTALDDPISYVRAISAKALGLIGDSRAADSLVRLLSENKAAVRAAAAEALGSINAEEVIAPLINALGNTHVSVREAAAQALICQLHPNINKFLLELIRGRRSPKVRGRGIWILSQRRAPDTAQAIITALADPEADVRAAAAQALGSFEAAQVEDALLAMLSDANAAVRASASATLGQIKSRTAVEPLISLLSDPEQEVLDAAATALRQIGDARMADAMILLLTTAHGIALQEAIYALGELQDERALTILTSISLGRNERVELDWRSRQAAQQALKLYKLPPSEKRLSSSFKSLRVNFGGIDYVETGTTYALSGAGISHRTEVFVTSPREDVLARAIKDLNGEDSNLQSIAADKLGKLSGDEAVDALLATLGKVDCSGCGFRHIVDALGRISDARAVNHLIAFAARSVEECSDNSIGGVANALGKIGDARAVDTLIALTRSPSNYVRGEAITALQVIGDARAVPAFMNVLVKDKNKIRRIQAAEGLAQLADPRAAEPLRIALFDPQPRVRAAAANALGRLRDADAAPILKRMVEIEEDQAARKAEEDALSKIRDI